MFNNFLYSFWPQGPVHSPRCFYFTYVQFEPELLRLQPGTLPMSYTPPPFPSAPPSDLPPLCTLCATPAPPCQFATFRGYVVSDPLPRHPSLLPPAPPSDLQPFGTSLLFFHMLLILCCTLYILLFLGHLFACQLFHYLVHIIVFADNDPNVQIAYFCGVY